MFWFISRNIAHGLTYSGDIASIDRTCNPDEALNWYNLVKWRVKARSEITIPVFGKKHTIELPLVSEINEEEWEDVTDVAFSYVSGRARIKYIPDTILGIWQELIRHVRVLAKIDNRNLVVFQKLVQDRKDVNLQTADAQWTLVLMKEVLDGYRLTDDYSIRVNVDGEKQKQQMKIQNTYTLKHPKEDRTIQIEDNYTAALRYNIFQKMKQFATGEADDSWVSLMFPWQYDVLKRQGKRTAFAAIRRKWKSVLLAFMALRAMMRETKAKALRPTSVLYLGLDFTSLSQVFHYLIKMRESFWEARQDTFHWDEKNHTFSFRKWKKILWMIKFLSCESTNPGIGLACDTLIIDEAFKIPRQAADGLMPMVTHEWADLICASTIYSDVRKDWFYDLLLEYEAKYSRNEDIDSDILKRWDAWETPPERFVGLRYTIDDEGPMTMAQVEAAKKEYAKNPSKYFCELYCRIPDEGKVFKYEDSIQMPEFMTRSRRQYLSIWYDPALKKDKSAIIVSWYSPDSQRIGVLEEMTLNTSDMSSYTPQITTIKNLRVSLQSKYQVPANMILLVMDTTGTQNAIADLMLTNKVDVDMRIAYNAWQNISKSNIETEWRVPKKYMVTTAKMLYETGKIHLNWDLVTLIKQLDNFYQTETDQYEWVGENDDHVNAMMMSFYLFYEYLGLKHAVMNEENKLKAVKTWLSEKEIYKIKDDIEAKKMRERLEKENEDYFRKFLY